MKSEGDLFMGEAIVITSGKGGVGKSTVSANVGVGLALRGKRVVLIDADIGLRNLDVVLGLENRVVYDLVDVIKKKCRLSQALIRDRRFDGLYLLPASQIYDKTEVEPKQMLELCESLKKDYDYIIIDCPAGIEQGFKNAIIGAEQAIVVVTPEVSSIRDADRVIGLLESNGFSKYKLIVNRVKDNMVRRGEMLSVEDVSDILATEVLGFIPDDERVVISTNKGQPLALDGRNKIFEAFERIAKSITGEADESEFSAEDEQSLEGLSFIEKLRVVFGFTA